MLNALHRSRSKRQGRHKNSGGRNLTAQLSCMQASPWPCLASLQLHPQYSTECIAT